MLIGAKADVDKAITDGGCTPVYIAAQNGKAECLQLLINAKADVDKAKHNGCTPVYIAVQIGQTECLQKRRGHIRTLARLHSLEVPTRRSDWPQFLHFSVQLAPKIGCHGALGQVTRY